MQRLFPEVLFNDDKILVLNKPAGMIVNNSDTSKEIYTLQDFINDNYPIDLKNANKDSDFAKRSGIVHRLDKETSGVLIVAKDGESFENLQKQFKNRSVSKVYIALVHGKLIPEGQINVPIGRLPWNRMRFGVIPKGRESFTEFKVLEYKLLKKGSDKETLTLVEVYPRTGRTHQIRVHFQYVSFPIFGDALYAGRKMYARDKKYLDRHFLHASKITFIHPASNEELTIVAPLPLKLTEFLSTLSSV